MSSSSRNYEKSNESRKRVFPEDECTYTKNETYEKKGNSGVHGNLYQLKLVMMFFLRGMNLRYNFKLASDRSDAGVFDDVVFKYTTQADTFIRFVQAKHHQKDDGTINSADFLNISDGDFSLLKYFQAQRSIKRKENYKNCTVINMAILSNKIVADDLILKEKSLKLETKWDEILGVEANCYKFEKGAKLETDVSKILRESSDLYLLAKKLSEYILKGNAITFLQPLFRRYQYPLIKSVFNFKYVSFRSNFINNVDLSPNVIAFRNLLKDQLKEIGEFHKIRMSKDFRKIRGDFKGATEFPNPYVGESESLKNLSNLYLLAKKLGEYILGDKKITFREELFRQYQYPLIKSVFDSKDASFSRNFINNVDSSLNVSAFRDLLEFHLKREIDESHNIILSEEFKKIDKNSAEDFPEPIVKQNEIDDFWKNMRIITTPNERTLSEIMKKEQILNFKQNDIRNVYSRFQEWMLNWFKRPEGYELTNKDAILFFQDLATEFYGHISFNVRAPIELFSGRSQKLEELHKAIMRNYTKHIDTWVITSQMTALCGLGGMGKTELARMYAHNHAKRFENVVWINAENKSKLEDSFFELARNHKVNIATVTSDGERKSVKNLVQEVYDFFSRRKVLFVFDDAENIEYFYEFLPTKVVSRELFILITSYEKSWESEIEVVELYIMELADASELIEKGLKKGKFAASVPPKDITNLATLLEGFPLALHQAIAYIKDETDEERSGIQDYLEAFKHNTVDLLQIESFRGIENTYAKTTYTTWAMTLAKLENQGEEGELAIKILNIIGFLSPESIKKSMFTKLNDRANHSIKLLIKYCMVNCNEGSNILYVHRLVQEVTRLHLRSKDQEIRILQETLELANKLDVKLSSEHCLSIWIHAALHEEMNKIHGTGLAGSTGLFSLRLFLVSINNF